MGRVLHNVPGNTQRSLLLCQLTSNLGESSSSRSTDNRPFKGYEQKIFFSMKYTDKYHLNKFSALPLSILRIDDKAESRNLSVESVSSLQDYCNIPQFLC